MSTLTSPVFPSMCSAPHNVLLMKNNFCRAAYITYQITTKQIDFSKFFLYIICSGCAAEP